MKKLGMIALIFTLILCTACGQTAPPTKPPADSLMQESWFELADGKVTSQTLNTVSADKKTNYTYSNVGGVESLATGSAAGNTNLTFTQMQTLLETLAAYTADPGIGFAGPYGTCQLKTDARVIEGMATVEGTENLWRFVYSVGEKAIKPLTGQYTGLKGYGMLTISNIDRNGNITDGSNQGKWCDIFIDQ
ncbi:MAG: hypothetical protein IKT90_04565 [Clostridia bacterium]|nr:hypothetical protein [Clostridia bacterium]